jgi:hypothetical protein
MTGLEAGETGARWVLLLLGRLVGLEEGMCLYFWGSWRKDGMGKRPLGLEVI